VRRVNEFVRFALTAYYPRTDDLPGLADLGIDEKIVVFRRETTWFFWMGIVLAALFFQIAPVLTLKRPWLATAIRSARTSISRSHPVS
jgi:hypothetical protein